MNLDDELRRMFEQVEDRLDVAVRADATDTIVAGAKRLRRRRVAAAAASGVLAVALLAGVGILLARPEPESAPPAVTTTAPEPPPVTSSPPAATRRSSSQPATGRPPAGTKPGGDRHDPDGEGGGGVEPPPPPPPPPVSGARIGPDGLGLIRLGMTYEELVELGVVQPAEPPPLDGCAAYEFSDVSGSGYVHLTATGGVQAILTGSRTHTVEGVSHGWTLPQVRKHYPEVTPEVIAAQNPVAVEVRGNPAVVYLIAFVGGDVVTEISLRYADQPCL